MNIELLKQFHDIITTYKSTDRQTIKINLKLCMIKYNFSNRDIISLGHKKSKVDSWTNMSSDNIPTFEDALYVAINFKFDITELVQPLGK